MAALWGCATTACCNLRWRALVSSPLMVSRTVALAAPYGYGLAKNHPFIDGNKRPAFVATELFLRLNGHALSASDADCVWTMLAVAAGDLSEAAFAEWIRRHAAAP